VLYPDFAELVGLKSKASRLSLGSNRQSMSIASGDYTSPFRGQGLAFHEVREYRPGDDIRSIDWRVTARTDKPHVKVFVEERERTVILCIDANASMRFGTRGTFKSVQAARAAALLGWHANGRNDRVGCMVFGDVPDGIQLFTPRRSRQALWQALKLLSQETTGVHKEQVSLDAALAHLERGAPTGALILIISDFSELTGSLERQLGNLHRRCDVVLVAVQDPADREIPAMGTIIFTDDAGHKLTFQSESQEARDAYEKQWNENRNRLEDIARRRAIGIVDLHTGKDVYMDLQLGLRRLSSGSGRR
jgi:uncharacterized protein (DUF58 family)